MRTVTRRTNGRPERTFSIVLISIAALLITAAHIYAGIGFRRTYTSERLVDPTRFQPHYGLSSSIWDSSSVDTSMQDSLAPAQFDSSLTPDKTPSSEPSPADKPDQGETDMTPSLPSTTELPGIPGDTSEPTAAGGEIPPPLIAEGVVPEETTGEAVETGKDEAEFYQTPIEEKKPYRPTLIFKPELPVEFTAELDTLTEYVVFSQRLSGGRMPVTGALSKNVYLERSLKYADRESWRESVTRKIPTQTKEEGEGFKIEIPVFKSKRAKRFWGGTNVGLSVSGNINISGSLTLEKKDELAEDDINPTDYNFKVDQRQSFVIKGKVGEKVSVDINQDSERLFDFENNLSVRYTGYEDEIIQSIEAGNVNLSLGGARLISGSTSHQGLFGLKTVSQLGALKLTTIASLEKGEKQEITSKGGAQSSGERTIYPSEYLQNRYFFLDDSYRRLFRYRGTDLNQTFAPDSFQVVYIQVYKSITGAGTIEGSDFRGWALHDPDEWWSFDSMAYVVPPNMQSDTEHQLANFELLREGSDYEVNMLQGWVRLNNLSDSDILAVAYRTWIDEVGELNPKNMEDNIFKLLKTKNPQPTDRTWNLMWRNVYSLRGTRISPEDFECRITFPSDSLNNKRLDTGENKLGETKSYIEIFGLDHFGSEAGQHEPDGRIDEIFVDFELGELFFPYLTPFNPELWYEEDDTLKPGFLRDDAFQESQLLDEQKTEELYTEIGSDLRSVPCDFEIKVEYKSVSNVYPLSFNVLKGSVEVYLNGQRLNDGTDYTVDYISGEVTILRAQALTADAEVEIKYENAALFQLDTKTLLGIRAEYDLWDNSHFGATVMHLNESTLDKRVRVGAEPTQNTVWDVDASMQFKPNFLTKAADWLPLIETDDPSTFTIAAEFAQVFPNPNNLNSPSTGDNNGVAYVDDFESIKRITPLGINRRQWTAASFPEYDSRDEFWQPARGRLIWFNPWQQIDITDVWPDKEVEAQASKIPVLKIESKPWWNDWKFDDDLARAAADTAGAPRPEEYWTGIMRYLGSGYADQSESKFLEIWVNRGNARNVIMHVDLGSISEDVIPNYKLNTEDRPQPGKRVGNGILTPDEDTGIDMEKGRDHLDLIDINGDSTLLPSYDDWEYNPESRNDYSQINGTEGNKSDEGGRYPDSEDLNNDTSVDLSNDFFRYTINLAEGDRNRYIVAGAGNNPNPKGWRLYRIPLIDTLIVGRPQMTNLEYARIWFTGSRDPFWVMLAQIDIVGNEWREVEVDDGRGGKIDPVSVSVINTDDNIDYKPPPGVSGERDPVTGLVGREQSLVLKVNRLRRGESGEVIKELSNRQKMNLIEYRQMKMFVNLVDELNRAQDLEIFLRFGYDSDTRYYEYSRRLKKGWKGNDVVIDFDRLTSLNFLRQQDSSRTYDILPDGGIIRVVGTPSVRDIKFFTLGLKNHGHDLYEQDRVEVRFDELRVSDIHRDPGWAATGSMDLKVAQDLLTLHTDLRQTQADFHDINKRVSSSEQDALSGRASLGFKLDALFNPQWKLSMPFNINFKQEISIPKYLTDGDVLLTSISDKPINIWSIFLENLKSNNRYTGNSRYQDPIDQQLRTSKSYSYSFRASKSKPSDNIFTRYTIERISLRELSYSRSYSSSPTIMYDKDTKINGALDYNLSFKKPLEIYWLAWSENVPLLGRLSESVLRPLPTRLSSGVSTTELQGEKRKWNVQDIEEDYELRTSRNFSIGFRPVNSLSLDFGQAVDAERVRSDSSRYYIARETSIYNTPEDTAYYKILNQFWIPDSLNPSKKTLDTTRWQEALEEDIELIKDKIFWQTFGAHFIDYKFSQTFSISLAPNIISWLGTNASYSPRYNWYWSGENFGNGNRNISVDNRLSTSVTLRLRQAMQLWLAPEKEGEREMEKLAIPLPYDDQDFDRPKPEENGGKYKILEDDLPSLVLPEDEFGTMLDKKDVPLAEEDDEKGKMDVIETEPDTSEVDKGKPEREGRDPLLLVRAFLNKLGDIKWDYSQNNNTRNGAVELGQATWKYRLGLTKDPGLEKLKQYSTTDSWSRSDQHTFGSSYEITQNLRISSLTYEYGWSHSAGQSESGSYTWTVWQSFEADDITIKTIPMVNWSIRWGGWERLPILERLATSVTLNNSFHGNQRETWTKSVDDKKRETQRREYEKNFSPLLGISFSWKHGISTDASFNLTQRVSDETLGDRINKDLQRNIRLRGSYTSSKGFRIPIPVWPFRNRRFKNSTTFALAYEYNYSRSESSAGKEKFDPDNPDREESSWSIRPSIDYRFSNTVSGGFHYEYAVNKSMVTGETRSQDFGFQINISIRG